MAWVPGTPLQGPRLDLEPLSLQHAEELFETCSLETFQHWLTLVPRDASLGAFRDFLQQTLDEPRCVSYAVRHRESGKLVGKSSLMDIRDAHRGLEIGMTWLSPAVRGTFVNPEKKWILLRHAFEDLGAIRVQLKTDGRNQHSQAAIRKLGATYEGTLRKHGIQLNGFVRDTVMFSITDEDWPRVRAGLEARLQAFDGLDESK